MKPIEVIAPTKSVQDAMIAALNKAGIKAVAAEPTAASEYLTQSVNEARVDATKIGTAEYRGIAFFWNYEYRHHLRDCTDKARQNVHAALLQAGLPLDGASPEHAKIIAIITKPTTMTP